MEESGSYVKRDSRLRQSSFLSQVFDAKTRRQRRRAPLTRLTRVEDFWLDRTLPAPTPNRRLKPKLDKQEGCSTFFSYLIYIIIFFSSWILWRSKLESQKAQSPNHDPIFFQVRVFLLNFCLNWLSWLKNYEMFYFSRRTFYLVVKGHHIIHMHVISQWRLHRPQFSFI